MDRSRHRLRSLLKGLLLLGLVVGAVLVASPALYLAESGRLALGWEDPTAEMVRHAYESQGLDVPVRPTWPPRERWIEFAVGVVIILTCRNLFIRKRLAQDPDGDDRADP